MEGLNLELSKAQLNSNETKLHSYLRLYEGDDAESLLESLELILDIAHRKFKDMFRESWVKFQDNTDMKFAQLTEICESLIGITKETIFNTFQFHPRDLSLYSELFSVLNETTKASVHHVYTTNYDRVVEEFCASREIQLIDGFWASPNTRRALWKSREFDKPTTGKDVVKLFKLHGSLNWLQSEYGIEQVMTETILRAPTPVYKKNLLIYPGKSKIPPEEEPFKTLYDKFETQMKETDRCLVIGFSFRDAYLNRVFRDFVRSGKGQLLVMSSNCKLTVAKTLLGIDEKDLATFVEGNNFVPIPCHFGDENWKQQLGNALRGIPLPIESPLR